MEMSKQMITMGRNLLIMSDVIFVAETLTVMLLFIGIVMVTEITFERCKLNVFINRVLGCLKCKLHRNK